VAARLADGLERSKLILLVRVLEMLGEVAMLSSVNGMTTYQLALSMHRVLTWRESGGGAAARRGPIMSNFNDNTSLVALISYLIQDGGQMFVDSHAEEGGAEAAAGATAAAPAAGMGGSLPPPPHRSGGGGVAGWDEPEGGGELVAGERRLVHEEQVRALRALGLETAAAEREHERRVQAASRRRGGGGGGGGRGRRSDGRRRGRVSSEASSESEESEVDGGAHDDGYSSDDSFLRSFHLPRSSSAAAAAPPAMQGARVAPHGPEEGRPPRTLRTRSNPLDLGELTSHGASSAHGAHAHPDAADEPTPWHCGPWHCGPWHCACPPPLWPMALCLRACAPCTLRWH
jgi:hypothetical protein